MLQDEKLNEELDHKGFNKLKDPRCDHNLTLINNQQLRIYLIYHNTYPFSYCGGVNLGNMAP
jgi:hypothetical protein